MNHEITYVQNRFGVVTNQRVIFYRSLGWFRGGHREDIPLRHVTSVRIGTRRHLFCRSRPEDRERIETSAGNECAAANSSLPAFWLDRCRELAPTLTWEEAPGKNESARAEIDSVEQLSEIAPLLIEAARGMVG